MRARVGAFLLGVALMASGTVAAQTGLWVLAAGSMTYAAATGASIPAVVIRQNGTGPIFELRGSDGVSVLSYAEDGTCTGTGCGGLDTDAIDTSAELLAIVTDETGTGVLVFNNGPQLITPTIADFSLANHDHLDADDGGTLSASVLTSGTVNHARLGSGGGGATKFLREDNTWQTIAGGGDALVANSLAQFAETTSAELAGVLSNETGTGVAVFGTVPLLSGFRCATVAAKTSNHTVGASECIVPADAAGTDVDIVLTLPTAASVGGRIYWFPRIDTDADGTVTLDGDGSETIEGAATYAIGLATTVGIYSDGTNWEILSAAGGGFADPDANEFLFWNNSTKLVDTTSTITLSERIQFNTAVCQNATASAAGNHPTTLGAAASCTSTTAASGDVAYAGVVFVTGGADTEWHESFDLPADWTGAVDLTLVWDSGSTTTNDVVWEVAIGCTATGEVPTGISLNDQAFAAVANNNVAQERNVATKTGLTMTGCAAGETAYFIIHRDTDTAGDTLDADVRLLKVIFTIRRSLTIGG